METKVNKNIGVLRLAIAGSMMYLLFVASPMRLSEKYLGDAELEINDKNAELTAACNNKEYSCEQFFKGLTIQLEKANTEIQERLNQETEWFKLKYYVVGALLLGFLANAYFKDKNNGSTSIVAQLDHALGSPATSFILSLTVVLAVSIDMQIRAGRIVINQLGTWIGYYVEPMFLGTPKHGGLGWEQFLRIKGAYHDNIIYAMTFWTNIYYLSIVLYILYLVVSRKALSNGESKHNSIVLFGFWLLHITLLTSSLSNHIVPFTFQVTLFPLLTGWFPWSVHPAWLIIVYIIFWALLVLVALKYINPPFAKNNLDNNI